MASLTEYMKKVFSFSPPAPSGRARLRPDLLLHPNIPKPLHGLNPRSLLGKEWWDEQRFRAYAEYNYRCWACGVPKAQASYHSWLEGHEYYRIDYPAGRAEMVEVVALCHACHNFIHNGRLISLYDKGEIEEEKICAILYHGFAVLKEAGLPPNPFALNVAAQLAPVVARRRKWLDVARDLIPQYPIEALSGEVAPWEDWRLILNGREYKPLWPSFEAWYAHYN